MVRKASVKQVPLDDYLKLLRPLDMSFRGDNAFSKGKSAFRGVSWSIRQAKWVAQIRINSVMVRLGTFSSEQDAARAYDAKARSLKRTKLNFPPCVMDLSMSSEDDEA
jgi:hypothetical protein